MEHPANWRRTLAWVILMSATINVVAFALGFSVGIPGLWGDAQAEVVKNVFWGRRIVMFLVMTSLYIALLRGARGPRLHHAAVAFAAMEVLGWAIEYTFFGSVEIRVTEGTARHLASALFALSWVALSSNNSFKRTRVPRAA